MPVDSRVKPPQVPLATVRGGWRGYLALGVVLVLTGIAAVVMPYHSNFATSAILGTVLAFAGIATVIYAIGIRGTRSYYWELIKGAAEVAGGVLIFLSPMKGAAALALAVAIVLAAQGVGQIGCGIKVRPQAGWFALALAGLASIVIAALLVMRFPYARVEEPGAMAGLALGLAGIAYIIMAVARRKVIADGSA